MNDNTTIQPASDPLKARQMADELKEANDEFEKKIPAAIMDIEKESNDLEKEINGMEDELKIIEKNGVSQMDKTLLEFALQEDELTVKEAKEDAQKTDETL